MKLNFDLNLLVVFNALFETRSATLAGRRLGRTQSAISNSLKKLRDAMGDPLFTRGSEGLVPTPRALEIHDQVRDILDNTRDCLDGAIRFHPKTSAGRIRIGAPDRLSLPLMLPLIEKVLVEAPKLSLHLQTTDRQQALDYLKDDVIDLVIGCFPKHPPRFESVYLFREELVCLCRKGHPILDCSLKPSLEELLVYPHLVVSSAGDRWSSFDEMLEQNGLTRQAAVSLNNFSVVPSVLETSDLIGVFTERIASTLVDNSRLIQTSIVMEVEPLDNFMVWDKRVNSDLKHQWLRDQVVELIAG